MKKWTMNKKIISGSLLIAAMFCGSMESAETKGSQRIGILNFKECVEKSKLGKQEQTNFENLKKQAEQIMLQREKEISELAAKINDPDYMESLSREAEAELKHRYKLQSQEIAQQQQQLYQTLTQSNYKILQKLTEDANKAAKAVAAREGLELVLNEDGCFYFNDRLDVTQLIIKEMDATIDQESQAASLMP